MAVWIQLSHQHPSQQGKERVYLGCYHKIPQTLYLIHLFLIVLEAGSLRSGCWHSCTLAMALFLVHSQCSPPAEGAKDLSGGNVIVRASLSFIRAPPSWFKHRPQAPGPNTVTLGGYLTHESEGDTSIQTIVPLHFPSMMLHGSWTWHFYFYPVDQNLVTRPYLHVIEAGKCSFYL